MSTILSTSSASAEPKPQAEDIQKVVILDMDDTITKTTKYKARKQSIYI